MLVTTVEQHRVFNSEDEKKILPMLLLQISGMSSGQNADIQILRTIHSPEPLPADNPMIFVSDSNNAIVLRIQVTGGMVVGAGSTFLTFKLNKWFNKNYSNKHGKQ